MTIRIIKIPEGEAPEGIRAAWVGLSLPVTSGLVNCQCVGVLTGRPTRRTGLWRRWLDIPPTERGYIVEAIAAVDVLAESNPTAAAWWRENTPDLFRAGGYFFFYNHCYVLEH